MSNISTVYLVDDSDVDNYFHTIVSEKSGVVDRIVANTCPESALEGLKNKPLQEGEFIFLDINMPRMSGFEFLDELSRYPSIEVLPPFVVMVSTSSNPKDKERAHSYSIVKDYLTKPLTAEFLISLSSNSIN